MPRDILIFGGLAGIISNILKESISWGLYFFGFIEYTFVHFCAGLVVNPPRYVKDPISVAIGIIIDFTIAASFSFALYLVMKKFGVKYWILKGLGFGMIVFLICYGVLRPIFSLRIESTPVSAFLYMIPNLIYGVTTSWFIKKYGNIKSSF
jgi:hypothetical protein